MERKLCGVPRRKDGQPCTKRLDAAGRCSYHRYEWKNLPENPVSRTGFNAARQSSEPDDPPASERVQFAVTDAAERRDVHLYAWTVAAGVLTGEIRRDLAAVAVSATRALVALPEQDTDRESALREAAAIGAMLHGIPPRDEAQWETMRDLFDEPTLEQLAAEKPLDGWFTLIGGGRQPRG